MKRLVMLAAILALGACSGSASLNATQRDEVSDIASDVADASVSESEKVVELQGRIAELEGQVEDLSSRLDNLEKWAASQ